MIDFVRKELARRRQQSGESMDSFIRRRAQPVPTEAETKATREREVAVKVEREKEHERELRRASFDALCRRGLSPELVDRLRGSTVEEIEADADALAAYGQSLRMRVPSGGFDGGARDEPPVQVSMDSILRAHFDHARGRIAPDADLFAHARHLDRDRPSATGDVL